MAECKHEILTVTEAAGFARVSRPTIYRWMQMQNFPVIRIGRCVRIPTQELKEWMSMQATAKD